MFYKFDKNLLYLGIFLVLSIILTPIVFDEIFAGMNSASYSIQSDSVNFGGGDSVSSSYKMGDTLGEIATGISSSTNYSMYAGFRQMDSVYLAVIPPQSVAMSPALGGLTGGTSNGLTDFKVITDDVAGYTATLKASTSPAMKGPLDSIADATTTVQFNFLTSASTATFGFTPEGTEIPQSFKDNGSVCGSGSGDVASQCWSGLSTSGTTTAYSAVANHPTGASTTLRFRINVGSSRFLLEGNYQADLTLTVLPL